MYDDFSLALYIFNQTMTRLLFLLLPLLSIFYVQFAFSERFANDLVLAAIDRTTHQVRYDGSYISIPYPNGDVPSN